MTFEYHVVCQKSGSKKLITVESKSAIVEAIKEKFKIQGGDIVVQKPYKDDWIDVENVDYEVEDSGKLAFFIEKADATGRDAPDPTTRGGDMGNNVTDGISETLKRLYGDDASAMRKRECIWKYLTSNQSYVQILKKALETEDEKAIKQLCETILANTSWKFDEDLAELSLTSSAEQSDGGQGFNWYLLREKRRSAIQPLAKMYAAKSRSSMELDGNKSHNISSLVLKAYEPVCFQTSKALGARKVAHELVALSTDFYQPLAKHSHVFHMGIELAFETYEPIAKWWKGEISGKQCAKTIIDSYSHIAGGVAGGLVGQKLVSVLVPDSGEVASAIGGLVGVLVGAGLAIFLSDRLSQLIFSLPKSEALQNAYRYLNLPPTASNDEVNKRFRVLALNHHPDKEGGSTEKFQLLQAHVGVIKAARES